MPDAVGSRPKSAMLPETEQSLVLHFGDLLQLTRDCSPAPVDGSQRFRASVARCPRRSTTPRSAMRSTSTTARSAGGSCRSTATSSPCASTTRSRGKRALKAGKGINMPDTDLPISALTDRDVADLQPWSNWRTWSQMSFVRNPSDVERLLDELDRLGGDRLGIVLKIETRQALRTPAAAVAHGDAAAPGRGDDRPRRSGGRVRL